MFRLATDFQRGISAGIGIAVSVPLETRNGRLCAPNYVGLPRMFSFPGVFKRKEELGNMPNI